MLAKQITLKEEKENINQMLRIQKLLALIKIVLDIKRLDNMVEKTLILKY